MDGDRFYEDSKENVERLVTLDLFSMKKMRKWFDLRSLPGCSVTELMTIVQTIVTKDLETKSEKSRFSIEASPENLLPFTPSYIDLRSLKLENFEIVLNKPKNLERLDDLLGKRNRNEPVFYLVGEYDPSNFQRRRKSNYFEEDRTFLIPVGQNQNGKNCKVIC